MVAASHNDAQLTAAVLQFDKSQINKAKEDGNTALHIAAGKNNLESTRVLLQNGANPNVVNNEGQNPLMLAATTGNVELCKLLMESGTDLTTVDKNGRNVLSYASKNPELIKALTPSTATAGQASSQLSGITTGKAAHSA